MTTSRKTKTIKYNIKDRGRTYTGQDRSNIDVAALVRQINSDATQEMVSTGSLMGFYGHQIRQRYGMIPPETAIADGKVIRLEPAFKTVEVSAKSDGTVSHVEEFLDNESGEFARRQYQAGMGGFSTAVTFSPVQTGGKLTATGFYGSDYVWQPNYASNKGDGALFDGLDLFVAEGVAAFDAIGDTASALQAQQLERQILQAFDSVKAQVYLLNQNERLLDQMGELLQENQQLNDKQAHRERLQAKRQAEIFDSLHSTPFAEVIAESQRLAQQLAVKPEREERSKFAASAASFLGLGF